MINCNKINISILSRSKKYHCVSCVTYSRGSTTSVHKGTKIRSWRDTNFNDLLPSHLHVSPFYIVCKYILWNVGVTDLAELGGSYCNTQCTLGISTPRPITSVHINTPLTKTEKLHPFKIHTFKFYKCI